MASFTREDLPVRILPPLEARVERAARRARKLGIEPPVLSSSPVRTVRVDLDGRTIWHELVDVTITAPEVIGFEGWTLLGRVDQLPDGSPIVLRTPGTEATTLPEVTDPRLCQHCGKRRPRSETFLVAHEDGRVAQVGRQCLRDFLGYSPETFLWWASMLLVLEEEISSYSPGVAREEELIDLDELLSLTSRVAAHGGWLGRGKAHELNAGRAEGDPHRAIATIDRIYELWDAEWRAQHGRGEERLIAERQIELWHDRYPDDDKAHAVLEATREALAEAEPSNEWLINVLATTSQPAVRHRHAAVAASAVVLGLRRLNPDRPERPKPVEVVSHHLGQVGDKVDLEAQVTFTRLMDGDWGARTLVKLRAEAEQADLLWWATGEWDLEEGSLVHLRGTIKALEIDRYTQRPSTVLTRCKLEVLS